MSDEIFMARAIELAARGLYSTDPNPRVGCVLVRNNQIIAEGWHEQAGDAHAEIRALQQAGEQARGATCYVTLEPCCHQGKTGPCTEALIAAGVTKVVAAMSDPNPLVAGNGLRALQAAGITVETGVLSAEVQQLNPGFIKRMQHGMPYVRVKMAMSIDGRTALANGQSQWITDTTAREDGQRLRARSSMLLTGINTILADDPQLNVRLPDILYQPKLVIADTHLRIPITARCLQTQRDVYIATASRDTEKMQLLMDMGVTLLHIPTRDNQLDLSALLHTLAEHECNELHVEAGATLAGALLHAQLVDECVLYIAPKILGDTAQPLFRLPALMDLTHAPQFSFSSYEGCGNDAKMVLRKKESLL